MLPYCSRELHIKLVTQEHLDRVVTPHSYSFNYVDLLYRLLAVRGFAVLFGF